MAFSLLLLNRKASLLDQNLVGSIGMTCRSKQLKSFRSEIQDDRNGSHLENLFFFFFFFFLFFFFFFFFFASSPESKG